MARALRRSAPLVVSACGFAIATTCAPARAAEEPPHPASLDEAIIKSAARHGVPESLVRRVVMRESKYNPHARNHSFWGLMQISYPTARSMGFHGSPQELLNPVTNLRYAVPYLANAFVVAGKRQDAAIRLYAHGYYEAAKHRGLLSALRTADSSPLAGVPDEPDMVAVAAPPPPQEDTGIFGALFGPQQMQRDPQTEQVAYASAAPAPAELAAAAPAAPPTGGKDGDEVAMTPDLHGALRPPKSWQHDGGTTVIARGEQGVEQVAAYSKAADSPEAGGRSRHRSHKSTLFASLDAPPAGAQAYAAVAGGGDPRLMQSESQAAIAQATSGQPVAGQPPADPQQATAAPPAAPQAQVAAEDAPTRKGHRRHLARRTRHHEEDAPAVASTASPDPQQAAAGPSQPQAAPTQAADAGGMQAQEPAPGEAMQAPQPMSADGAGQPTQAGEAAASQAQPQQQAAADAPADATPTQKHRHRSRHARAHKATDVAAQAPGDGEPQPAEYQPK